jgi:hypothetical protein
MLAYKSAKHDEICVLITLEIPQDAITNISRSSVVVKETAKYRTNKAKVLKIEDTNGNLYETADSGFYEKNKILYKVGNMVECTEYDMDIEKVCSKGIHFFLNRTVAEEYKLFGFPANSSPHRIIYYANGRKKTEYTSIKGKIQGLYQEWYPSGQIKSEYPYTDGELNGLVQKWYPSGQKKYECMYIDDKANGLTRQWYPSGQKEYECVYVNDNAHGLYQQWYSSGQIEIMVQFQYGKLKEIVNKGTLCGKSSL